MLRSRHKRSGYLDLELSLIRGVRCEIYERPGLWLSGQDRDKLVEDMRAVAAASGTAGELDYGVLSGRKQALDQAILTLLYDSTTQEPLAFNAMSYLEVELQGQPQQVIHLGLVMVRSDQRSRGLTWILYGLTCFLLFARRLFRPVWISNVTQVPAVFGSVCQGYSNVYPSPDAGARRSFAHQVIAEAIMDGHRHVFGVGDEAGFDADRFVITNAYTGGSDKLKKPFDDAPKHRFEHYNEMCQRNLDYGRGDDFLQIGQIDLAAARRYLLRQVPRRSLLAVSARLGFAFFASLLLPLIHWFAPGEALGEIRPWK